MPEVCLFVLWVWVTVWIVGWRWIDFYLMVLVGFGWDFCFFNGLFVCGRQCNMHELALDISSCAGWVGFCF